MNASREDFYVTLLIAPVDFSNGYKFLRNYSPAIFSFIEFRGLLVSLNILLLVFAHL